MAEGSGFSTPSPTEDMDIECVTASLSEVVLQETPKSRRSVSRIPIRGLQNPRKTLTSLFPRDRAVTAGLHSWTDTEYKFLTQFILLHTDGTTWVSHKHMPFWDQAGVHIQRVLHTSYQRSGT